MSVRKFFKEDLLSDIIRVRPDELAPSLGNVILAIGEEKSEGGETPYYKPSIFFELTYPSDNFISVLKNIVEALRSKGVISIFLNLDMGSGKTHLLTLLLHLFASYNLAPQQLSGYLDEYKNRTGYNDALAKKTVAFAFDLRTPKLATRYLKLTEILLGKLGQYRAAGIVKKACEDGRLPDAKELAEAIDESINILVLIDELHYAATLGDEMDRRIVREIVKFVLDLLNYRRILSRGSSGIAIVVASARRDFNRWLEVRDSLDAGFRTLIEGFVDQMQRIESTTQTRWLSLDETKRVLEKRLGLNRGEFERVFHKSFDKFIERVVKADTDVPQAHHLRSLIKAMAFYALEAYRASDDIVTPARFTEDVIDVLLPGSELAVNYKSIYGAVADSLKNSDLREEVSLATNLIFSLTITGAPEKLVEMVRVAKTKTPPQDIPLVKEVELREILRVHGLLDPLIDNVVRSLDTIHPNIHRVSLASGDYAYFVVPIASVLTIFRKMIDDGYKELMGNPEGLAENICEEDLLKLAYSDDLLELRAVDSLKVLEKKPLSPDKFYVYIYVKKDLLTQLADGRQTKDDSFNEMRKEAEKFLKERAAHNLVIVLPKITEEALKGKARSLATDNAASRVINEYLAPLEEKRGLDEVARKLLEIELGDLKAEMGRRLNDALAAFTSSMRSAFAEALYYTPKGVMPEPIAIELQRKDVKVDKVQRAVDIFRNNLSAIIEDVSKSLAVRVKQGRMMLVNPNTAIEVIHQTMVESLKANNFASFRIDEHRVEKLWNNEDRWIYIPPKVMEQIAESIAKRVEDAFKDKYVVKRELIEGRYKFTIAPITLSTTVKPQPLPSPPSPTPLPQQSDPWAALRGTIASTIERGGGAVWVKIEVKDKDSADRVIRALSIIRDYIKESRGDSATAIGS